MPVQAPWACKCGKRVAAGQPCPCCSTARKRTYDANRPNARARGYDNKWDKARADFLAANPWCVRCARYGSQVPATVVNHIIPHKMDLRLFWNRRNWAALCAPCHNGPTQSAEKLGSNTATRWGYSIPSGVQPSLSPVTLVCGPPASGKTTYVKARAAAGDTIIDFDDCLVNIGAQPWSSDASSIAKAFKVRDDMIRALATTRTRMVWLIVSAPSQEERSQWRAALGDVSVVVMETQIEVCIERINADPARAHAAKRLIALAKSWPKGKGRSRPADNARDRRGAARSLRPQIREFLDEENNGTSTH